jgi:SMI1/KNR4 family protein SUKH-1
MEQQQINWKLEIVKLVYIKQAMAGVDRLGLYPYHLPKVRATTEQVGACERALGFRLDDDHKEFLLHADGWDGFIQDTDLFGTLDFRGSRRYVAARSIFDGFEDGAFEDINVPRSAFFPIGASLEHGDVFVTVRPGVPSVPRVFWFTGYEVERYPSFWEFFLAMLDANRDELQKLQEI